MKRNNQMFEFEKEKAKLGMKAETMASNFQDSQDTVKRLER